MRDRFILLLGDLIYVVLSDWMALTVLGLALLMLWFIKKRIRQIQATLTKGEKE
jgi:hypothetical protein